MAVSSRSRSASERWRWHHARIRPWHSLHWRRRKQPAALSTSLRCTSMQLRSLAGSRRSYRSVRSRGDRRTRQRSIGSGTHTAARSSRTSARSESSTWTDRRTRHAQAQPALRAGHDGGRRTSCKIKAPSSVSSVIRRSSSRTPSGRKRVQSPPPGKTLPRSRGPSKVPPVIGAITRVPCGTHAEPLRRRDDNLKRHQRT